MESHHRPGILSVAPTAVPGALRASGPLLALLALTIGFALADSGFATLANLRVILDSAAVPLVLAVGMTFVIRQGSIDLSVEGVMAACSLLFALVVANDRMQVDLGWLGLPAAAALGGVFGLANGLVVTRLRVPSFMATLGMGAIALGAAMLMSGDQPPLIQDPVLRQWGLGQTFGLPNLALAAAACLMVGLFVEQHTRLGRYGYVIGGAEGAARASGIDVDFYKVLGFAFAGLLIGLAAAMESARLGLGHVGIGEGQMLGTITAAVIGGTPLSGGSGSVRGSAVGVLTLAVLANGMVFIGATPDLEKAIQGAIVLVAVVVANWHLRDRLRIVK